MQGYKKFTLLIVSAIGISIMVGCSKDDNLPATQTIPPIVITPTIDVMVTPTGTLLPFTETPLPPPTQHYTVTPLPTLPPGEALEKITELLETNGGCKLPCWWGITPGETTWETAQQNLAPLAEEINTLGLPGFYGVGIDPPEAIFQEKKIGVTIYVEEGIIQEIQMGYMYSYPISKILNEYGYPTDIFIQARLHTRIEPPVNFRLVLFYEDQGILAHYLGGAERSEVFQICPSNIFEPNFPFIFLWSPDDAKTFKDFIGRVPIGDMNFSPLDEVTNIDIETFYDWYQDPNSTACFEMPDPDLP